MLIDGESVRACVTPVGTVAEREIVTIEGLADGDKLHPVQEAFVEHTAFQCGYCTPGFIIAAKGLLDQEPEVDEARVRHWLAGNLCRCTGYDKIVRAVLDASVKMKSG